MTRRLYHALIALHPIGFRREFAAEMLWIYDEAAPERGGASLLLDACVSLARQWLLRGGTWKALAGLAVALCQIEFAAIFIRRIGRFRAPAPAAPPDPDLAALMTFTAWIAVGLVAAVVFLVFWWRRVARRARV